MADENTPQVTPETKATEEKVQDATKAGSTSSVANAKSGLGIASLVLGIVGIVGSWMPILNNISFIVAILGVIFGAVGLRSVLKGKKSGKGIAVAGLVISIIACVIVIGTQNMYSNAVKDATNSTSNDSSSASTTLNKMSGDATEEILANDLTVDIPEYTIEQKTYGNNGYLNVTLTNKGSEAKTFSVEIEAVDSSGNRVSQYNEHATASNLAPGQSQTQQLFSAYTEDSIAKYQEGVKFKIIKVTEY